MSSWAEKTARWNWSLLKSSSKAAVFRCAVFMKATGKATPIGGLGDYLDCPIIGINQIPQNGEAEPDRFVTWPETYADRLQAVYPDGPYNLLGWSFGGPVAHEVAIELRRRGCVVHRLILLDPVLRTTGSHHALDGEPRRESPAEPVLALQRDRHPRPIPAAHLPARRRVDPPPRTSRGICSSTPTDLRLRRAQPQHQRVAASTACPRRVRRRHDHILRHPKMTTTPTDATHKTGSPTSPATSPCTPSTADTTK